MTVSLIVDCDTGIDDALALLYLLATPDAEIVAIGSVWGNTPATVAADNTLRVLELAGAGDIPVCVGAAGPLVGTEVTFGGEVHGTDGLGNLGRRVPTATPRPGSAVEQLVQAARARPGELTLLATGPLTNLALALHVEPRLPELVRGVSVMGGAIDVPGNASPLAEANIWHDPEAAAQVLGAPWPVQLVGLDVTMEQRVRAADLDAVRETTAATRFAWEVLQHYFDVYEARLGERAAPVHDMLTALLAVDPSPAEWEQATVHVETGGASRGATYVDRRSWVAPGGNVAVARRVAPGLMRERLLAALVALP